jgi:hypothetical protein
MLQIQNKLKEAKEKGLPAELLMNKVYEGIAGYQKTTQLTRRVTFHSIPQADD